VNPWPCGQKSAQPQTMRCHLTIVVQWSRRWLSKNTYILATDEMLHVPIVNVYFVNKFVTFRVGFWLSCPKEPKLFECKFSFSSGFLHLCSTHKHTRLTILKNDFSLIFSNRISCYFCLSFRLAHNRVHFPHTFHLRLTHTHIQRSRWANHPYI